MKDAPHPTDFPEKYPLIELEASVIQAVAVLNLITEKLVAMMERHDSDEGTSGMVAAGIIDLGSKSAERLVSAYGKTHRAVTLAAQEAVPAKADLEKS